jgi:hypothetical protein
MVDDGDKIAQLTQLHEIETSVLWVDLHFSLAGTAGVQIGAFAACC